MIHGSGRCHYHPDRPGLGVCVECRNVVCRECTTPFDGINRCAACLAARLHQSRADRARREWTFGNVALAALGAAALFGGIWGTAWLFQR